MKLFRKDKDAPAEKGGRPEGGIGGGTPPVSQRHAEAREAFEAAQSRVLALDEQLGAPVRMEHDFFDAAGKGERVAARLTAEQLTRERAVAVEELGRAREALLVAGRDQVQAEYSGPVAELCARFEELAPRIERQTRALAELFGEYQEAVAEWTRLSDRLARAKSAVGLRPADGLTLGRPSVLTQAPYFGELGALAKRGVKDITAARSDFKKTYRPTPRAPKAADGLNVLGVKMPPNSFRWMRR